jgi:hypothetical protein
VLLGIPTYHERRGLMRAALHVDDMVLPGRNGVQLSDSSIRRLRLHIARLTAARVNACGESTTSD